MIKLFDRVKVNIPTTGTGDIEFGAAASTAFLTPTEAGVLDGDEVRYVIVDGLDFEEGIGLIKDTVATMERTVTKSKVGGTVGTSALNLSGTAVLALTASAADILTPSVYDPTSVAADAFDIDNMHNVGATGASIAKADDESDVLDALPSVYELGNILGAVGYSGGKNTGAVLERGSNANGNYLKLADGTLICWKQGLNVGSTTFSVGSIYAGNGSPTDWTFPASFTAAPAVSSGIDVAPGRGWVSCSTYETTYCKLYPWSPTTNSNNVSASPIAVGRWRS